MHALLLYLHFTGAITTSSSDPEFVEVAQAYTDVQASNDPINDGTAGVYETLQHQYMTGLVEDMATALSSYGASKGILLSFNYYKKLVWGSLQNTNTYKTIFNTFQKEEIEAIFDAQQTAENQIYPDNNGNFQTIGPKGTVAATAEPCE